MRCTQERLFNVKFRGEDGTDWGGTFDNQDSCRVKDSEHRNLGSEFLCIGHWGMDARVAVTKGV